jgi:hypothetical protein
MAWASRCGDALVDMGAPLGGRVRVDADSHNPLPSEAVGYSILEAGSLEDAAQLLDGHPHLQMPDGTIDVVEALPLPGA